MRKTFLAISGVSLLALSATAQGVFNIGPLTSFGGSDGWLSTNEYSALTTTGNERAIAYGGGFLYLQSGTAGAPTVRYLDPMSGAELGQLNMAGVAGGVRVISGLGVGADGAIYGGNLSTALSDTSPFRVWRWANNSATAVQVYSGSPLAGARLGDSFDVTGGGANTRIAAGYGNTPAIAGNNGYAIIDPTAGTGTHVAFPGTPPAAGDFRLGITFGANANTVFGDQGCSATDTRLTSFLAGVGSLDFTLKLTSAAERQMDFAIINGTPVLATVESTSLASGSTVRVYELTDPANPVLLGTAKNATTAVGNSNGSGGIAWGGTEAIGDGTTRAYLYAMNANNGLQAFVVVVPEPGSLSLAACGLLAFALWRKARK